MRQDRLTISLRFARYLLWEFRWSLGVFWTLVLGGGLLLRFCYHHQELGYLKACHAVFLLIFLESSIDFPDEWYLQPLFFLLPIVGLGAVADSVVRLAFLVFTQKRKLPEWHRMAAALHRNHLIVVGVGKVGYRVLQGLLALREPVVAIERESDRPLVEEILDRGVPVIHGDARLKKTLEQAGIAHARAVILATSDDLANLDAALTAREMNPKVQVVLRLFDDTLAAKFAGAFSMPAISTAQVAAPAFIAAATGRKVYQQFQLSGQTVHLVDIVVHRGGRLVGRSVGDLQSDQRINVIMHQGPAGVRVNPTGALVLAPGDELLVIAPLDQIRELEAANQPQGTWAAT